MSVRYRPPVLLEADHDLDGFECRSEEQTEWLRRHGRQSSSAGTTRVLVVTAGDSAEVVAYYAWCMAGVALADAPQRLRKGAGRSPQPVTLLARLGVALEHHGLGAGLLQDVIARTHALVPEFEPSPTDPLHLVSVGGAGASRRRVALSR